MLHLSTIAFTQARLDEHSIVKDSSGLQYDYAVWSALMRTGDYTVRGRTAADGTMNYLLRKLTPEEKDARAAAAPKPAESRFFTTGGKVASFSAKDLEGNKYKLKDLEGKIVVMNFWFVGCPPCRMEIPELNRVADAYKNNPDVVFLAIALDEKWTIEDFLKKIPFHYHIVDDGRYIAQNNYGITTYPTHLVLDRRGIVRFHTTGYAMGTVAWVKKTIDALLAEGTGTAAK